MTGVRQHVIVACTQEQAELAARELSLDSWRRAHNPFSLSGCRASQIVIVFPVLGTDKLFWDIVALVHNMEARQGEKAQRFRT